MRVESGTYILMVGNYVTTTTIEQKGLDWYALTTRTYCGDTIAIVEADYRFEHTRLEDILHDQRELANNGIPEDAFDIDPWNEWGTHDELRSEELERIEAQAEAEELRHNGYWD